MQLQPPRLKLKYNNDPIYINKADERKKLDFSLFDLTEVPTEYQSVDLIYMVIKYGKGLGGTLSRKLNQLETAEVNGFWIAPREQEPMYSLQGEPLRQYILDHPHDEKDPERPKQHETLTLVYENWRNVVEEESNEDDDPAYWHDDGFDATIFQEESEDLNTSQEV